MAAGVGAAVAVAVHVCRQRQGTTSHTCRPQVHLREDACDCKHGPASVHALRLGKPLEALGVAAQAQRVKAKVTGQAVLQGSWQGEWHTRRQTAVRLWSRLGCTISGCGG